MPDYLSCGTCQSDFELSDILQFIEHKRRDCNVNSSSDLAMELLECVKCLRKFHTPWPLLRHVQSEHHISVVRNLVLPTSSSISAASRHLTSVKASDLRTIHTQTVRTCLKRLVCPYQTNLPAGCCLKVEAPSEEGCCCLDSTEKSSSPGEISSCQPARGCGANAACHPETNATDTMTNESDNRTNKKTGCGEDQCPCAGTSRSPKTFCDSRTNEDIPPNRCGSRSRGISLCCDQTQSLISFGERSNSCKSKNEKRRNSFCCQITSPTRCPCKPNSNTADQTCQTDFAESFDIDMDLLLDSDDLNVAMESTFHEDTTQNTAILAPSKAIQTVVHASNFENYSATAPSIMANEMNVTSETRNTVSMSDSFVTTNACSSSSTIQQAMRQYQDTFNHNENEMNASYMYDQERSDVHQISSERSQLWTNSSTSESIVVQQESLLNLLGSSTGISSNSFDPSIPNRSENPSSMQESQITVATLRPHGIRMETFDTKRKRATRDYRFNCSDCDKVFRQNVHLRKHIMAKHTKQKPHKCTYCRYTTVEKSHLTVHIRTHTGEKPFRCRICNYSTAQNCTLKSHYLRKHPGSNVQCNLCGIDFITNHERDKHEKVCRRDENLINSDLTHIQVPNIFSQGNQSLDGHTLNEAPI